MTKEEALALLEKAPRGNRPSRVNTQITEALAFDIIFKWINKFPDGAIIPPGWEIKRVYQIAKNQRDPEY